MIKYILIGILKQKSGSVGNSFNMVKKLATPEAHPNGWFTWQKCASRTNPSITTWSPLQWNLENLREMNFNTFYVKKTLNNSGGIWSKYSHFGNSRIPLIVWRRGFSLKIMVHKNNYASKLLEYLYI